MKQKNDQGFTLVEMCVVIVLIGIICVATVPATAIVRRQEAKKFALELCYDLDLMRQQSMANGKLNTLTLERTDGGAGDKNTYKISEGLIKADNEKRGQAFENKETLVVTMLGKDRAGTTIEPNLESITFKENKATKLADGSGEAIPKLVITVVNKEQKIQVEYDTLTGNYEVSIL